MESLAVKVTGSVAYILILLHKPMHQPRKRRLHVALKQDVVLAKWPSIVPLLRRLDQ